MREMAYETADMKYCIPSDMEKKSGIWMLRTGRSTAGPEYAVGPKMSECYSLHFVLNGDVYLMHGEEETLVNEGDAFCLFPHARYSYRVPERQERPLRLQWIAFDGGAAEEVLKQVGLRRDRPVIRRTMRPELSGLLERIFHGTDHDYAPAKAFARQKRIYHLFELLAVVPKPHKNIFKVNWLQRSVDYMDAHYMEGITVTDVVEHAGVHRTHLYCEFIRVYGISPSHYLMKLRMERAAALLTETDISVTEAAYSLGYSNLHTFSRAFAKYYRTSPTAYRQQHELVPV